MRDYGHPTLKPTILVGTVTWLPQFDQKDKPKAKQKANAKPKAKSTLVTCWQQGGKTKVRGNRNLKESQVYPVQFALAVVRAQWPKLARR